MTYHFDMCKIMTHDFDTLDVLAHSFESFYIFNQYVTMVRARLNLLIKHYKLTANKYLIRYN